MGAITDVVKSYVPASYRAMVDDMPTAAHPYALSDLQNLADYVKFKLLGTVVDSAAEATVYDRLLINFLGKLTTLQFIPAAMDYWGDQLVSETATGTNESRSYPDRVRMLEGVFDKLRKECQTEFDELAPTYGFIIRRRGQLPGVSYGDNGRDVLITTDPQEWDQPPQTGTELFP